MPVYQQSEATGLGVMNYESSNGCFPSGGNVLTANSPGPLRHRSLRTRGISRGGAGCPATAYIEQQAVFNAFNFAWGYYVPPWATADGTHLSVLTCPEAPNGVEWQRLLFLDLHAPLYHGTDVLPGIVARGSPPPRARDSASELHLAPAMRRAIFHSSSVTIASITDGTSNTMMIGEYVYGRLSISDQMVALVGGGQHRLGRHGHVRSEHPDHLGPDRRARQRRHDGGHIAVEQPPRRCQPRLLRWVVRFIENSVSSWQPNPANPIVPYWPNGLTWTAHHCQRWHYRHLQHNLAVSCATRPSRPATAPK